MKKKFFFIAVILLCTAVNKSKASDLFVREFGTGGAYLSVNAAIAAANNGDRIVIQAKAGGAAYIESLTITKSLTFVSENEGEQFYIQGDISIIPASPKTIIFIGLKLQGNISVTADAPSTYRTIVKILYSLITTGSINFDYNNYNLTVANTILNNGRIMFRDGNILGNKITVNSSNTILIDKESGITAPHICDTIKITGNFIYNNSSSSAAIYAYTDNFYYSFLNNYIQYTSSGLDILEMKNSSSGTNDIINNTFKALTYSYYSYALDLSYIPSSAILKIYNNLFQGYSSTYSRGITGNSVNGAVNVGYNLFNNSLNFYILSSINDDGTNITNNTGFTLNSTTGEATGSNENTGHPNDIFADLDLSRNNIGCYGGSFSMTNFFHANDNYNKVIFLNIPRRINAGTNIKIKAESFDK